MGVHATERVAQLILGLVSVSQFRPRTASHAVSRGVIKKRVDTRGTPSTLDSVSSTSSVMDLRCRVPSNRRRLMGRCYELCYSCEKGEYCDGCPLVVPSNVGQCFGQGVSNLRRCRAPVRVQGSP